MKRPLEKKTNLLVRNKEKPLNRGYTMQIVYPRFLFTKKVLQNFLVNKNTPWDSRDVFEKYISFYMGKGGLNMEVFQVMNKTLKIRLPREVDHHSAEEIRYQADRYIMQKNINRVEFDFRDTEFMDSSGIGLMMGRYQNIRLLGGSVAAIHVKDRIFKILRLAGITKVIQIEREHFWNQSE